MCNLLVTILISFALLQSQSAQPATTNPSGGRDQNLSQKGIDRIIKEVRHELVLLPLYGVFDNLAYRVSPDGTVTLVGQVVRPTLKADAENVVKHIEGVERVDNEIQVLPTSSMDDQIRVATYRAIYGNSVLSPYSLRAVPPIHIIVDRGHVTLEGVVARQMDKQIAETQAKSVPNVFSVTNNLPSRKAANHAFEGFQSGLECVSQLFCVVNALSEYTELRTVKIPYDEQHSRRRCAHRHVRWSHSSDL